MAVSLTPERKLVSKAFSMTLLSLRRKAGIAQEKLALEAKIDRGYMGGLERGQHVPTLDTIYKLLPVLQISFVEFAQEFEACMKKARRELSRK